LLTDWPNRLRDFSRVVDVIEDDTFINIKSAISRYFESALGAHYFGVYVDGVSQETEEGELIPALDCLWTNDNDRLRSVVPIRSTAHTKRLVVLSYLLRKPLWLVARDGGLLADTREQPDTLVDLWSRTQSLPDYRVAGDKESSTAILVPLEYGERRFGVMTLEFEDHLRVSERAKENVSTLADALGRIIWIWKTTETQLQGTRDAFDELERSYESLSSPLQRRTVFVASSGRADEVVMKVILDVLHEFEELFDVNFWRMEVASGNINEKVRSAIAGSDFGIWYISEPSGDSEGGPKFFDNPNVLFEAGMLQMLHELRDDRGAVVSRWIPIRESPEVSPPLPFDFAGDRVINVPRTEGVGAVDESVFTEMFRGAVTRLVDQLDIE
jgi:hypothetical protein